MIIGLLVYVNLPLIIHGKTYKYGIEFTVEPDYHITTFETNDVTFPCSVRGKNSEKVIVRWKKSKYQLKRNTQSYGWSDGYQTNSDLHLFNVTPEDNGYYWCEALLKTHGEHDIPQGCKDGAQLTVLKNIWKNPPKLSKKTIDTQVGKTVKLPCEITNLAQKDLMWADEYLNVLIDGSKLVPQYEYLTGSDDIHLDETKKSWLTIRPVRIHHGKSYFCFLKNTSPVQWQEVELRVMGCPAPNLPGANSDHGTWFHKKEVMKCYGEWSKLKVTFGEAERLCRQHGGHLAMPKTQEEMDAIVAVISQFRKKETDQEIWIGLDDFEYEQKWKWADGRALVDSQKRWRPGEPNNGNNKAQGQDCASLRPARKQWDDDDCVSRYQFLCETPDTNWFQNKKRHVDRCPPGWTFFDCEGYCYKLSPEKVKRKLNLPLNPIPAHSFLLHHRLALTPELRSHRNFNEDFYCWLNHAEIAMPKKSRQQRAVWMMILAKSPKNFKLALEFDVWIGLMLLRARARIRWEDGDLPIKKDVPWGDWKSGQGECYAMNSNGIINIRECSEARYIACRKAQKSTKILRLKPIGCGRAEAQVRTKRDVSFKDDQPNFSSHSRHRHAQARHRHAQARHRRTRDNNTVVKSPEMNIGNIHNGQNMEIEDYPWMVRLLYGDGICRCGGVLIGPRHVLTAAHCLRDLDDKLEILTGEIFVGLGSDDKFAISGIKEAVHMIKIHPLHTDVRTSSSKCGPACDHDFAVIELKRNLPNDCWNIRPACLAPQRDRRGLTGLSYKRYVTRCRIAGFGLGSGDTLKYCTEDPGVIIRSDRSTQLFRLLKGVNCKRDHGDSGSALVCINDKAKLEDRKWTAEATWIGAGNVFDVYIAVDQLSDWVKSVIQENARPEDKKYYETICYGDVLEIVCDYGRPPVIKIDKAIYGRTRANHCPHKGDTTTTCKSDVKDTLTKKCGGQNFCHVKIDTRLFPKDPCHGVTKYLELEYRCVYADHVTKHLCYDASQFAASCGRENGLRLTILGAYLGRNPYYECSKKYTSRLDCMYQFTYTLQQKCEGTTLCVYGLYKQSYPHPCKGLDIHFTVTYRCRPVDVYTALFCSDPAFMEISCEMYPRTTIEIVKGFYGRASAAICPNLAKQQIGCNGDITKRVGKKCNGKPECTLALSKVNMGNPCPGFSKYFDIQYRCKSGMVSIGNVSYTLEDKAPPPPHNAPPPPHNAPPLHAVDSGQQQQLPSPVLFMITAIMFLVIARPPGKKI